MNGGSVPAASPAATSPAARLRVAVFLVVRPVAEAVLEVDAEVLDRLALQLLDHARVDACGEVGSRPSAAASVAASGACSSSARSATAPSFCAASALNRCAPP